MFEKIPSLKDFIIYFIPGVITLFFGIRIINSECLLTKTNAFVALKDDTSLIFVGTLLSLIIGFLISQFQIITFKLIYSTLMQKKIDHLAATSFSVQFKDEVVSKIKDKFKLTITNQEVMRDRTIIDLCYNYIRENGLEESVQLIDRNKNLSNLALCTPIPCITVIYYITNYFQIFARPNLFLSGIIIAILALTSVIWYNFRRGWTSDVFSFFYVICTKLP